MQERTEENTPKPMVIISSSFIGLEKALMALALASENACIVHVGAINEANEAIAELNNKKSEVHTVSKAAELIERISFDFKDCKLAEIPEIFEDDERYYFLYCLRPVIILLKNVVHSKKVRARSPPGNAKKTQSIK